MRKFLILFFVSSILLTNLQFAHAGFASGQNLIEGFQAQERIKMNQPRILDVSHSMRMWGYIQGTIDSGISAGILCIQGKNLTLKIATPIIDQYLKNNPEMKKKAGVEAVMLALYPLYKCS